MSKKHDGHKNKKKMTTKEKKAQNHAKLMEFKSNKNTTIQFNAEENKKAA